MIDLQSSALAAQGFGCLAPSARHLCRTGPGIASNSVRCGIFWNSRTMSLLPVGPTCWSAEAARQRGPTMSVHGSYQGVHISYMSALSGLRLIKSGWNQTDQAKIKPNLTLIKPKNVAAPPALDQKFCIHLRPSTLRSIATKDGSTVKIGKPRQGKASVLPPPGGYPGLAPDATSLLPQNPLFSILQFGWFLPPDWVVFPRKNTQFMTDFCRSQIVPHPLFSTVYLRLPIPSSPRPIRPYSTLFVGFFREKIRNFFTRPFLKIWGKSIKNGRKNPAKTPLKTCGF